jgi:aryl-alcohol dehydrogenase-like predicted oxidoreductase
MLFSPLPFFSQELDGTIETCLELGITPVALNPLADGYLSTRYARASAQRAATAGMLGRGGVVIPSWAPPQLQTLEPAFRALSEVAEAAPKRSETQVCGGKSVEGFPCLCGGRVGGMIPSWAPP